MKEINFLKELERVNAPAEFENELMTRLTFQKEKRRRVVRNLRFSLAGLAAFVLIIFLGINFGFFRNENAREISLSQEIIPVMETINYSTELETVSYSSEKSKTVFILEQVMEKEENYF
ncbi:MAG: hypothetical protein ACE5WD_13055 [Candidatus Aminicenantia bacterium]